MPSQTLARISSRVQEMAPPGEVVVGSYTLDAMAEFVGTAAVADAQGAGWEMAAALQGKRVWNINTTASGGGVAELLRSVLPYARGLGIDARWFVVGGTPAYYRIVKRAYHALYGGPGDDSALDHDARLIYEQSLIGQLDAVRRHVVPGDVVVLHDLQVLGLAPHLAQMGARVLWRCHLGTDEHNAHTETAWAFLRPYMAMLERVIFLREAFIPDFLDRSICSVIPPSIDPTAVKNRPLTPDQITDLLVSAQLIAPAPAPSQRPSLTLPPTAKPRVLRSGPRRSTATPMVTQISRWDRMKDPVGVLRGFALFTRMHPRSDAYLLLAGPEVSAVADDPEDVEVSQMVVEAWLGLPSAERNRIDIAFLPMADHDENALLVNALQRHASVVIQKSLSEGFGLTVTEALWKARPVIASARGGILDQVDDGAQGRLLQDPSDPCELATTLGDALSDSDRSLQMARAGQLRVGARYLTPAHICRLSATVERLFA
jgi:trehalose synthase